MSDEHALLAEQFDTLDQQNEAQVAGMWAFLATEILVFGAMFTGYAAYRAAHPQAFEEASRHLNILIGAVNTVVLLGSSLTMALAVHAARTGRQKKLVVCLILTALLGTAFMAFKAVEYYSDYVENLVPKLAFEPQQWVKLGVDPRHVQLFLMFYYIMTGLHALHLTIGIAIAAIIIVFAWRGKYSPQRYIGVELFGLYWHFVDIVWIFLLPLLYLIGTHSSLY